MPNSGKSHLANTLGEYLKIPIYDIDQLNPKLKTLSVNTSNKEWLEFRQYENKKIREILKNNEEDCIVSTGGGCLEYPLLFNRLLNKDKDEIIIHIIGNWNNNTKKVLRDDMDRLWKKRGKWYSILSDYEFYNHKEEFFFLEWFDKKIPK